MRPHFKKKRLEKGTQEQTKGKNVEGNHMNSETLLNEALGHLEELERVFADLASRSEHEVQRSDYLAFREQVQEMQNKLNQDLDNIDDTETFTMSLDRW